MDETLQQVDPAQESAQAAPLQEATDHKAAAIAAIEATRAKLASNGGAIERHADNSGVVLSDKEVADYKAGNSGDETRV